MARISKNIEKMLKNDTNDTKKPKSQNFDYWSKIIYVPTG